MVEIAAAMFLCDILGNVSVAFDGGVVDGTGFEVVSGDVGSGVGEVSGDAVSGCGEVSGEMENGDEEVGGDAGTGCVEVRDYVGTGFGEVIGGEENVLVIGNDAGDWNVLPLDAGAHEHGMLLFFLLLQRGRANAQPRPDRPDTAGQRIDRLPHDGVFAGGPHQSLRRHACLGAHCGDGAADEVGDHAVVFLPASVCFVVHRLHDLRNGRSKQEISPG